MRANTGALAALSTFALVTFLGAHAGAYCRLAAGFGDPDLQQDDPLVCDETEPLLQWGTRCIPIGVQKNGSEALGLTYEEAHDALGAAINAWVAVDCGGGKSPGVSFVNRGALSCDLAEFEPTDLDGNNNILLFHDDVDVVGPDESALTTLTYRMPEAVIFDADIELLESLASDGDAGALDVQAVLTHHIGHVLGFAHSDDEDSVMHADRGAVTTTQRELSPDDIEGMCAVFPPNDELECPAQKAGRDFTRACATRERLSSDCNVSAALQKSNSKTNLWFASIAALGLIAFARRGRSRWRPTV